MKSRTVQLVVAAICLFLAISDGVFLWATSGSGSSEWFWSLARAVLLLAAAILLVSTPHWGIRYLMVYVAGAQIVDCFNVGSSWSYALPMAVLGSLASLACCYELYGALREDTRPGRFTLYPFRLLSVLLFLGSLSLLLGAVTNHLAPGRSGAAAVAAAIYFLVTAIALILHPKTGTIVFWLTPVQISS